MTTRNRFWSVGLAASAALALLPACATKKYVSGEVERSSAAAEKHIADVESQVEQTQSKVGQHEQRITELDKATRDALDRANDAGKLAQGKFNYSVVLSDDNSHFPLNRHELSSEAKQQLDEFVDHLKNENKNVYLEIQGHTDATGVPQYNQRLGEELRVDVATLSRRIAFGIRGRDGQGDSGAEVQCGGERKYGDGSVEAMHVA